MSSSTTLIFVIVMILSASLVTVDAAADEHLVYNVQMAACGKKPEQTSISGLQTEKLQREIERYFEKKIYTTNYGHKIVPVGVALSDGFIVSAQFFPTSSTYKVYSGTVLGGATNDTFIITKTDGDIVLVGSYSLGFHGLTLKSGKIVREKTPTVVDVYYKKNEDLSAIPLAKELATSFSRFFYPASGFGHIKHYEIHLYNLNELRGCERVDGKLTLIGCHHNVLVVNALKNPCKEN